MADQTPRLNKPVSDEMLYAAGLPRNLPEGEPTPLPPAVLPDDTHTRLTGIEYRAMAGYSTASGLDAPELVNDKRDTSAFDWLADLRKG